jgi:Lrp/AsnC family transcriptional regulator, leucine-responsive regulatory protein
MIKNSQTETLDALDRAILRELQADGHLSNADLARRITLSPPATHTRVRRLEQAGYIRGYTALLNREVLGYDLLCFIEVTLQLHQPEQVKNFPTFMQQMPEVLECHHVTGGYDYLLKVVVRNRTDLEHFLMDRLTPIPGVARIQTHVVLDELKATTTLSLDP